MQETEKPPSLESLGEGISRLQKSRAPKPPKEGMAAAMQYGLELVSGVAVGTVTGIFLDRWLGTAPIFLLVCFCFGTAGGALTLYRSATADQKAIEETEEPKG